MMGWTHGRGLGKGGGGPKEEIRRAGGLTNVTQHQEQEEGLGRAPAMFQKKGDRGRRTDTTINDPVSGGVSVFRG